MPYIHLENQDLEYEFSFDTKYLVITGDSGNGKSNLVELVASYESDSTLALNSGDKNIISLARESDLHGSGNIIFVDEDNKILWQDNASSIFNNSDNYFVIISRRRSITQFKLSLDSLVEMKISKNGRYHTVAPRFPKTNKIEKLGDCIVCEDKKSGKQFLEKVLSSEIESADSNTRFIKKLNALKCNSYTLVFDRAGIGYLYERILINALAKGYEISSIIDWDSFESYILESEEYGCRISAYPDKEVNATKMFKEVIDRSYDKSHLPASMKYPVYWKIKDAKELLEQSEYLATNSNIF